MKIAWFWICLMILCFEGHASLVGASNTLSKSKDPQSMEAVIERIESAPPLKKGQFPRLEKVRENELNAYISRRIAQVREPMLSELKVKPLDENRVKGSFTLDFSGMDIPVFLSSYMTFRFSGHIETDRGKGRLIVGELFLKDEPVTVEFLDMALSLMASLNGYEARGIEDWYELPYGISRIRTMAGYAEIFY